MQGQQQHGRDALPAAQQALLDELNLERPQELFPEEWWWGFGSP